ncbi:hypothetical protein [Kitasatospora sp. NPDC057015]|uniref:hypothetical protein n=1 Tax=Kitasatospora sp. NPDC057015 TaxID=3346001 RepID=UPI003625DA52
MRLDPIAAVAWATFPRPRHPRPQDDVAADLRALATATTLNQAADATTLLLDGALIDDLAGELLPAAVAAGPILLDIVEHAHPRARSGALDLLHRMLVIPPTPEFPRVDTPRGPNPRLCCAVADQIRDRRAMLREHGAPARRVLAAADTHWRFEIRETAVDARGVTVLGLLAGRLPVHPSGAESHRGSTVLPVPAVEAEYAGERGEALLLLRATDAGAVPPGTVLRPADCGRDQD